MAITPANETKILGAIGSLNLIRILYSKKKKPNRTITERVVRVVEPYEIKDDYLYAGGRYLHRSRQDISWNIIGDLNLDGTINILDVIEMVSLILEDSTYNELADINSDGMINVVDVIQLVNIILSP